MRRLFDKEARHKMFEYWRHLMQSTRVKMSLGAQYITRIISMPHGEGWRRNKNHHKANNKK